MLIESLILAQTLNPKQEPLIPEPIPIVLTNKEKPKQKLYTVKENDNLTKIAKKTNVSVQRIWSFNKKIKSQDQLSVGQRIKLPPKSLKLKPRAFVEPKVVKYANGYRKANTGLVRASNGAAVGNSYQAGQCVWFIKNKRPDIPNGWGSAYQWLGNARRSGWRTGSTPRVNAVGVRGNHVVLITGVSGNTVTYKDMNGSWRPFEIGHGKRPASFYTYIY